MSSTVAFYGSTIMDGSGLSTSITENTYLEVTLAVASRLPLVYKNYLIELLDQAIMQPARQSTLEVSLHLLFSHYSDSRKSVAFFLQCLSALSWKEELSEQLKSETDATFSLLASYPQVFSRANEINKEIKEQISSIGVDLSLLSFDVELVRLSLLKTILPSPSPNNTMPETFNEMFNRLLMTTDSPPKTASIVHSVLSYFHCKENEVCKKLVPYLIPGFSLHASYPEMYLKLRMVEFLCHLEKDDCELAMMAFSCIHLNDKTIIDKYSPLEFVGVLFDCGKADLGVLNELAGYFNQPKYFQLPVCEQQKNEVTEVRQSFMINRHHAKGDDFRELHTSMISNQLVFAKSSLLEIFLSVDLAHLSSCLSDLIVENFFVHLNLFESSSRHHRPFSQKEQIVILLAIRGLNVTTDQEMFSKGILNHSIVYLLLHRLGYPVKELATPPSETEELSIYIEYPDFNMLLTLANLVRLMSNSECAMFEGVLSAHMHGLSSSRRFHTNIASTCDILASMHNCGSLDMNEVLKWLHDFRCSKIDEYNTCIHEYHDRCIQVKSKYNLYVAIEKGVQEGYVLLNNIKIVICGPPCVGKTAFKDLLANRPPPRKHHSTAITARPIHAIERIAAGGKIWKEITEEDLVEMLSDIIQKIKNPVSEFESSAEPDAPQSITVALADPLLATTTTLSSMPEAFLSASPPVLQSTTGTTLLPTQTPLPVSPISSTPTEASVSLLSAIPIIPASTAIIWQSKVLESTLTMSSSSLHTLVQSTSSTSLSPTNGSPDLPGHEATNTTSEPENDFNYASRKIFEQMSSKKMKGHNIKLHEATWIHLLDSGGQPQFTDLLRMFVRGNSLYIIVMKVTKSLDDKPTFVYSINGKALNTPKEMTMTNLQIIVNIVRSIAATSRSQIGDKSEPAFAIVATHCDKSKFKRLIGWKETIKQKNETLLSCLKDFLHLFVFYKCDSNELVFPVDNLCRLNRETISADICQRLLSSRSNISFSIKIPVRWYVFDLNMKNEASKETHGMISLESCYSIGQRLGMDQEEVDECLIYLDSMRLCIYYPKLLPHVIFTNPQFLIGSLSNIVRVSFVHDLKQILPEGVNLSQEIRHSLRSLKSNGTFDQSLLDILRLTFIPGLFSKDNLMTLLQHFLVISIIKAAHDTKYFIPILLPAKQLSKKQKDLFATFAEPLLITFNDKIVLQGLFPTLVVSLLSRKDEPFFFIDSGTCEFPQQLRHAVKLYTEELFGSVFLCENYESIEVYFTGRLRHCYLLRKVIIEALSASAEVLQYDEKILNMTALIHCNRKHSVPANDGKVHPITISYKNEPPEIGCSVESSFFTIAINDLSEKQSCWLIGKGAAGTDPETISLPTDGNALLNHTHAPIFIDAIKTVVFQWETLGIHLGIKKYKLDEIKYNCRDQVEVCRKDMIYHWIDTRRATCNKLIEALEKIGERAIIDDIKRLQVAE